MGRGTGQGAGQRRPKVVVDVFGTGPRVIRIGALLADRVTFAVGANPARIAWALEIARTARREAGLDPDGISYEIGRAHV